MWKDQNVRIAASFLVGVLVGVGGYWMYTTDDRVTTEVDSQEVAGLEDMIASTTLNVDTTSVAKSNQAEVDMSGATTTLRVDNQNPGKYVVVAHAALRKPAWVAIHEEVDGKPGNIIGARLFDTGKNSGIVELLRPTVVGKNYYAMLHVYNNVKRPFNYKVDVPMKDERGNMVMVKFAVTKATD